jgi:hypothetical protein
VRFDERSSRATRIKYMTDGMLVREALVDPQLSRYKVRCAYSGNARWRLPVRMQAMHHPQALLVRALPKIAAR